MLHTKATPHVQKEPGCPAPNLNRSVRQWWSAALALDSLNESRVSIVGLGFRLWGFVLRGLEFRFEVLSI